MRKIRTLKGKVLVERTKQVEQTQSGLWLPSAAREKPTTVSILATSTGSDVKIGTRGLIKKFHDRPAIEIDGVECEIIYEDEILAAVEPTIKKENPCLPVPYVKNKSRKKTASK